MTDPSDTKTAIAAAQPAFSDADLAEILPAVERVLRSGRLILGEETEAFESAFRDYIGVDHAVAVSSCSAALQIALRFFRAEGREVILPANNFPGVVSAILYEGGVPVLAEMDPVTFCIDAEDAVSRITPKPAGMIVVHLAGLVVPEIDRLREVCQERGLFLIEDAAHAHGAAIGGRRAGALADAACFSFYPTKIMTTGTGGMITTNNPQLAGHARLLRHHGQGGRRNEFIELGSNWCMSEIHAALGLHELARLDERVAHRNRVVEWYREDLAAADWISIPRYAAELQHAYYKLPAILAEDVDRDQLRRTLEQDERIENGTIYDPPCHLQPAFRERLGLGVGAFPVTERALARQLCPPVHAMITREQVRHVVETMSKLVDRCRRANRTGGA